jgi:hypothetical protein
VEEAIAVCDAVERWQDIYGVSLGRRLVHAADEYYLMAGRAFPEAARYEGFAQHENGIGMARSFIQAFTGDDALATGVRHGFFAAVDGAPAEGYRAPRHAGVEMTTGAGMTTGAAGPTSSSGRTGGTVVVTGTYGQQVLRPVIDALGRPDIRLLAVENEYFGGNIGVAGLLTGTDLARVLADQPTGDRYLLPDACLSGGRFLDGLTVADLPRPVELVPTDGASLRRALEGSTAWVADADADAAVAVAVVDHDDEGAVGPGARALLVEVP